MENGEPSPLFIAACPAWVKYAEQFYPSVIPLLSKVKSPQQIVGILIKTLVAEQLKLTPEQIFSVSVTPCTAMKFESKRDGMMRKGISDVDAVLTVRELSRLIRIYGIDILTVEGELADEPMADRSSSAVLAETSGGIAEAVIRSLFYDSDKTEPDKLALKKLRSSSGFRETTVSFKNMDIKVAVIDGLNNLDKLALSVENGNKFNLIEVMACQGGCVHGGGLPFCSSKEVVKSRSKVLYMADETEAISVPGKSPSIFNLYDKFLKENTEISDRKVFYTHYVKREVLL
jgi:iron only hydrogenase large subunit-like protein